MKSIVDISFKMCGNSGFLNWYSKARHLHKFSLRVESGLVRNLKTVHVPSNSSEEVNKILQFCLSVSCCAALGECRCEEKEGVLFWISVQYRPGLASVLGHTHELPHFPCDVDETSLKMKGLFHDFLLLRINQSCYKLRVICNYSPRCRELMGEGTGSGLDIPFTSVINQYWYIGLHSLLFKCSMLESDF